MQKYANVNTECLLKTNILFVFLFVPVMIPALIYVVLCIRCHFLGIQYLIRTFGESDF